MIGTFLDKIFRRTFTLMKLNFMFIMISMMGGILLGVGPAFLSITDLYIRHGFKHEEMHFTSLFPMFKDNFKRGNTLFYTYGLSIFFVVYNLYLSFQFTNPFVVLIQIIMVFVIGFLMVSYLYCVVINSYYQIKLLDLIKLGTLSFFANLIKIVRLIISMAAIYFIYKIMPGLLIFGIFSLLIIVSVESLRSWVKIIEETITY